MFTSLVDPCLHARVRLGESLKTFDEFWEIGSVLDLNSDLDDGGDGEPHDLHVVGSLGRGQSTALQQELIDTDKTNNVTSRAIFDRLDVTTHHQDCALNRLDEEIVLLSGQVVGTLDTDFGTGLDGTREDTTKGVETSFIGSRHHLGYVEDKRTLGITIPDTDGGLVVHGALVEGLYTVALSGGGGRKIDDYHLQEGVTGGKEFAHNDLEEGLAFEVALFLGQLDVKLLQHGAHGILLEVHDGIEDFEDGVENEHVEGTFELLAVVGGAFGGPLLCGRVEVVVAPELEHHLLLVYTEFLGVASGELPESETPSVKTRSEGDGTLFRIYLDITEGLVVVGGNDDVDRLDGTLEGLEEGFLIDLQLEKGAIDFVDDNDGLDTLGQGLTEHSFCLHADTLDTVNNDESTVSDTESSGDL